MPDHLGDDMRKVKVDEKDKEEPEIKGNLHKNEICQVIHLCVLLFLFNRSR
jgi:hypothetical protein